MDLKRKLTEERNQFIDEMPTGTVRAFEFLPVIKRHPARLDEIIDSIGTEPDAYDPENAGITKAKFTGAYDISDIPDPEAFISKYPSKK